MADKALGSLTAATTPLDGTELHYIVQGGNSRQVTGADIVKISHTQAWSTIGSTPTTLAGYGITDAQASNSNLTAIAALSPSSKSVMIGNGTTWTVESGSTLRASLGLAIGTDIQAYDADLTTLGSLSKTEGNFIVGSGSAWTVESGATARASLGLTIGTNVQAYNAKLASLAGLTLTAGDLVYATGANAVAALNVGTDGQILRLESGMPVWATATGTGDMAEAIYDPTNKASDAFSMDNMVEGTTAKIMTGAERTKLDGIEAGAQVNLSVGTTTGTVAAGDDSRITGAAQKDQNLGDLDDADVAIGNLGAEASLSTKSAAEAFNPSIAPDYLRTAGYSSAGDGGGALYKKAAAEPTDLPAPAKIKLPGDRWYRFAGREFPLELGAKGDGLTDNTTFFDDFSAVMADYKGAIIAGQGTFKTTKPFSLPNGFTLIGQGAGKTLFDLSGVTTLAGALGLIHRDQSAAHLTAMPDLAADIVKRTEFYLTDTSDVNEGDWLCLYNPTDYSWIDSRPSYHAGEWVQIARKDPVSGLLVPTEPLWHLYDAADIDVYKITGPQVIARDFSILGPYLETTCLFVDTSIHPIIENVETYGTHYAGVALQRTIEPYVNCRITQKWDDGAVGNEYGVVFATVHGGEVHGEYHSQRHGIAQGNSPVLCCVPNRKLRVFSNTSGPDGAASLDFGHGCSEGLELHGGRHSGIVLGGARHKFYGGAIAKAEGHGNSTVGGEVITGSEFRGGLFEFLGTEWRSQDNAVSGGAAPIQFTLTSSCVEPAIFKFDGNAFINEAANAFFVRIYMNNCPTEPSLIIKNPYIEDQQTALSYFSRLDLTAGNGNYKLVEITGVTGLGDTIRRLIAGAGITATKWKFDPQFGETTVAGDTGLSTVSKGILFPHSYPTGATPHFTATAAAVTYGGARSVVSAGSANQAGANISVSTCDGANFADTTTGTARWRVEFPN